jgi:NhaP-type Na+/H+ or K+/H+ antiporter
MAMTSQKQRALLLGFIGSIACCGLVGVYCLLIGQMNWIEARVLGTTAAVGAASILGLASAIPWERRRWHPVGPAGMVAVAIALLLVLVAIWGGASRFAFAEEMFLKAMGVACVIGVALPHVGLLALARLRRSYGWVRRVTIILIVMLTALIAFLIVFEPFEDFWARLTGIFAIGVVCGTIAVPVLHRVSAIRTRDDVRTVELELSITCPRCSETQNVRAGRSKCGRCGLKFRIEIEEEHCASCGYPLYKLMSSVCPECGTPLAREAPEA